MSNSWWEIKILCDPAQEEPIFWRLEKFGCRGTATEVLRKYHFIRAYVPEKLATILDLGALAVWLEQDAITFGFSQPVTQWNSIDEEDWASNWKVHWQPTEIGDRFLIYPAWLSPPENPSRLILRLDPGVAFGTGMHPTTQLCLESLEMRFMMPTNPIIADIGCGSGILSIGACLLGAKQVYGVDTDPLAVDATRNNRNLNEIDPGELIVTRGSTEKLLELQEDGFDGIVCNILAETIIELMPSITGMAKPTTWGILSGILLDRATDVTEVVEENGWIVATLWKRQEWCCLNIRRSED